MRLVTVATHSERYFPYLKQSAEKHGHDLIVLGWGEKWQGFTWRFSLMREYLKTVPDDEVVCFIDGYDVIVLEGPQEIEQKYRTLVGQNTNRIVISKETIPEDFVGGSYVTIMQSAIFTKCNNHFINAGTYIGTAKALRNVYSSVCKELGCSDGKDDQVLLGEYCNINKEMFLADEKNSIFLVRTDPLRKVLVGENNIQVKGNILFYNNTKPSILHAPGNTDIDDVIEKLGYDPSIFSSKDELWIRIRYCLKAISHFGGILFKQYWWILLLIILVVVFYVYGMPTKARRMGRRR
jgi:hypothetical protein